MTRQLRIEYEGAAYHVLSRGNDQQAVFLSVNDRNTFLQTLARLSERFEVDIIAFVLMDNHYHLLLRTHRANLSKSMQTFRFMKNLSKIRTLVISSIPRRQF
jgi:REP element-mobilizing transposase RayT